MGRSPSQVHVRVDRLTCGLGPRVQGRPRGQGRTRVARTVPGARTAPLKAVNGCPRLSAPVRASTSPISTAHPPQRIPTMTKRTLVAAAAVVLASPLSVSAQNPLVQSLKSVFDITKTNIMATAEILDDELYAYRPTRCRSPARFWPTSPTASSRSAGAPRVNPTPVPRISRRREGTKRGSSKRSSWASRTASASSLGPRMRGQRRRPTFSALRTPSAVYSRSTPLTTTSTTATS